MRNIYSLIILALLFASCKSEFQKCDIKTKDIYLKAYNDILNEIIIRGTYNRYLGKNEERIFKMYDKIYEHGYKDSGEIKKIDNEIITLHNKMFGDTTQFWDIYLDDKFRRPVSLRTNFETDTNAYTLKFRNTIKGFPGNREAILNSIGLPQSKYKATDFKCGIANIKSVEDLSNTNAKCYIGTITLSNLVVDKVGDRGLLYYEFKCGGLCGYGCLITIKKVGSFWKIDQGISTWMS